LDICGIVLAGGKSLRFGRNKLLESVRQKSLLEHVVSCINSLSREVIIVTSEKWDIPRFTIGHDTRIITDIYPGKGPLGGTYTGLVASKYHCNFVAASDMPFLDRALIEHMIELADHADMVIPRLGNLLEPLHAVYTKDCLAPMEDMLRQGKLSLHKLISLVKVRYVDSEEIEKYDPEHLSFFNINTRMDLEKAKKLSERFEHDKC